MDKHLERNAKTPSPPGRSRRFNVLHPNQAPFSTLASIGLLRLDATAQCECGSVKPALPEGQEDDRLDGEELEHRLVRPQQVAGGEEEEEEGVEGQADREVVDDGDVQVSSVDAAHRKKQGKSRQVVIFFFFFFNLRLSFSPLSRFTRCIFTTPVAKLS